MTSTAVVIAILLASSVALHGQQTPQPAFDVVSIKPSQPNAPNRLPRITPGRVEIANTTLKQLIGLAYSRFPFDNREIVGPSWIDSERFDILATMERPPQVDGFAMLGELSGMLRSVIEQRFGVKAHNEQREGDVYTLTYARSDRRTGAGLRQVPDACTAAIKELTGSAPPTPPRSGPPPCSFGGPPGTFIGTGVTMAMFVNVLAGTVGRPVVDRTGLAGSFDVELTFDPSSAAGAPPGAPPGPSPADDSKPSVFTALQEQLGLKLEATRGPVDVLVVDSAERPTPN